MNRILQTNIQLEAINGIEMVAEQLSRAKDDVYRWKWVIIILHNTLQNCMVLALLSTNHLNALTEDSQTEWLKAYGDPKKQSPGEKLDYFLSLYNKIKGRQMRIYTHSKPFQPDANFDFCVEGLHDLRNRFIHFTPKTWSIDLEGMPNITKTCIKVIEFLLHESGNIHLKKDQSGRVRDSISRCLSELKNLDETVVGSSAENT